MKLIFHCAVICLAFATACFTGPEIAADAKPIPGCASNTECQQGRRISRHVQGQPEPRSESSNTDLDDDSSDLNPDRCSTDPCKNNGTCVEGADNYTCSCADGFRGRNCEEAVPVASCQEGWILFNGSCYYLSDTVLNWEAAVAACNGMGGYLAEIESQNEQDLLTMLVHSNSLNYLWIGLNDKQTEGQFVWYESGAPVSFTYWHPAYTGSTPSMDCVILYYSSYYYFLNWFEDNCSQQHRYICETDPK